MDRNEKIKLFANSLKDPIYAIETFLKTYDLTQKGFLGVADIDSPGISYYASVLNGDAPTTIPTNAQQYQHRTYE